MTGDKKIKTFTDLLVWQKGHEVVLDIYKITETFPRKEVFGLSSQMQRAAVSITINLAEGFSRKGFREKVQFFHTSLGSATELENQLIIARDLGYLTRDDYNVTIDKLTSAQKLLNAFIKKTKTFLNS